MTSRDLIDALAAADLLTDDQIAQVRDSAHASDDDPTFLAEELVGRAWLTRYQIDRLLQGDRSGLWLGAYVLLEPLGEGGMGTVFKARHRRMKRLVALKIIRHEWLSRPDAVGRFYREVELAGRLSDPHIVTAFDAGEAEGVHYFVMEYVVGLDLARLVRDRGPLSSAAAAEVARQAALGLAHAHDRGLIHRDIKPSNLLRADEDGVVKVLDFGLAFAPQGVADELTQIGSVLGTPDYLAPEQAMDIRQADARSDLYGLGCTLYFLLVGSPPFPGGTPLEKLVKHREIDPAPVEALRPGIPRGLGSVVRRLMAKRPEDRFPTAAAVAEALAPFRAAEAFASIADLSDWTRLPDLPPSDFGTAIANPVSSQARGSETWTAPSSTIGGSRSVKRNGWLNRRRLLALIFLLAVLAGVFAVRLATRPGTIVVEVLEMGVELRVDRESIQIDSRRTGRVNLGGGRHRVQVKRGAEVLYDQDAYVRPGDRTFVPVRWAISPEAIEARMRSAWEQLSQNHLDAAIDMYTEVIRLAPGHAWAYNMRGEAYLQRVQDPFALADFDRAIALDPSLVRSYKCRGWVLARNGQNRRAIQDFGAAIRLAPGWSEPYVCRAELLVKLGDIASANADFRQALALDPNAVQDPAFRPISGADFLARGDAYLKAGNHARAIADYSEAIRIDPRDAAAFRRRAQAHAIRHDSTNAEADNREADRLERSQTPCSINGGG